MLLTALIAVAAFLLGLRAGLALGRANERRRLEKVREQGRLSSGR